MAFNLVFFFALLERTPAALNVLLRDLPDRWTQSNEGEGSWTAFGVVGHLLHGERTDWIPRLHRILEHGESKPFDPLDREAQNRESVGKSLPELLDDFASARAKNLAELRRLSLQPADFSRRGMRPSLGSVTVENLLATWAAHDLTHVHQLSRILAHQVREEVGPWSKFLGVLQCDGHSS